MSSSEALVLPERMAQYVDAGRLRDNFHNHPESQRDLSGGQQLAVQEIRACLEQLPLFHYTDSGDFLGDSWRGGYCQVVGYQAVELIHTGLIAILVLTSSYFRAFI